MTDSDLRALQAENEELRRLLDESESTLAAIRNGEVDALVIGGKEIYTLEGADHPYRVLVEAMQPGAVTLSPNGFVVYCNAGFSQMIRRPIEKIIGVRIETLFSAANASLLQERLSEGRQAKQAELTLRADDGSLLPVLVTFNLVPLADFAAVCLVITDLTEHKQNQQLQDTDRRKNEFLAMLAHELRNPLAPITNATQILCLWNRESNEEVQWACNVIERQVQQMTRIIDDLLDVSRITRGKINLQIQRVNISAIVSAAVETSRPLIESRRHQLHVSIAAEPLQIDADSTRMAQALTNLLNNAAKYTEEGGDIWLTVQRDESQVVISVRDNGIGIPAELIPKVFDLFTQADRTIDRSQGGLGIGLTLVRNLVEMHGGSVNVSSPGLGRGSTFVMRLPLAFTVQTKLGHVQLEEAKKSAPVARHRILVVDDNADSAMSLALMLKSMGHDSLVSHDGPMAIEMAAQYRPTLVLLDIGLPKMNGYMVAERLRELSNLDGVVLAALTGYGEEQDRKRSEEAGFDRHFVKPLNFSALQELISSLPERVDG